MRHDSKKFTVYLGILSAIAPLSIDMGLPGVPAIEATFASGAGHGAMTLSLFVLGFGTAPLFCGPLSDKFGRRATLIAGLFLFSCAAAAAALAPTFSLLLIARLVQGAAAGACATLPLAMVRDVLDGPAARSRLSQIVALLGIAPILAPLIGAWVMAIGGWRAIFMTQAVAGVLQLCVAIVWLKETLASGRRRSLDPRALLEGYRTILSDRLFARFGLTYTFSFSCMFIYISASPAVFIRWFNVPEKWFAAMFSVTSCGVLAGALLSTGLSKTKATTRAIVMAGLSCMATSVVVLFAAVCLGLSSQYTVAALATIVTISFGLVAAPCNHMALSNLGHVAGSASGLMRCIQMLSAGIASGLLAGLSSGSNPLFDMALLMLAAALAAFGAYVVTRRSELGGDGPSFFNKV